MKTRIVKILGAVGVMAVGAGALLLWPKAPQPASPPSRSAAVPSPVMAAAPARSSCDFVPGQRLSYAAALRSSTRQMTPGLNVPADVELDLSGRLDVEVLTVLPDAAILVGRLPLQAAAGKPSVDAEALRFPFLVAVDSQCQVQRFARWAQLEPARARNQQALLWETQFRLGAGALHVADTSGVAAGQLTPTALGVHRALTRYESTWPTQPAGQKLSGTMDVELGEGMWFEHLASRRDVTAAGFSTRSTLTLRRQASEVAFAEAERQQANYLWGDLLPGQPRLELAARPVSRFDRERQDKVRGQTVSDALDAFAQRVKQGVGTQSTWPDLAAYFEVHPETLQPALEKYKQGELPPNAAGDFFLALGKTRNDQARQLLLGVMRDERTVMMDQVRSMFALVTRTDVTVDLAKELAAMAKKNVARRTHDADFVAGESMLALSTMSGLRNDPDIAQVSRQALTEVMTSVPTNSHGARVALRAVGNTGDLELLPAVMGFTVSDDVDTRKAAAHVFSRMPAEVADPLEVEWLKRERNPFVQKELYRVFQQQHFDLQQGASRLLVEQTLADLPTIKSAYTRKSMVLLIAQSAVANDPQIRKALVEQARRERAKGTVLLNAFGTILTRQERLEVLR